MSSESLNMESISEARRKAIEKSIKTITVEELKSLGQELFPQIDNPWRDAYFRFLEENAGSTFHHATTSDRIQIVYCLAKEKGMWFLPGSGMGPLQARGLQMMKEVVGKA